MLEKAAGAVRCAHCHSAGAVDPCLRCGGLVCPGCAADAGSCPVETPATKMRQLNPGTRLIALDLSGGLGLALHSVDELKTVDLETGMETYLGERLLYKGVPTPLLGPQHTLISVGPDPASLHRLGLGFAGMTQPLPSGASHAPILKLCLAEDGQHLAVLREDGALELLDLIADRICFEAAVGRVDPSVVLDLDPSSSTCAVCTDNWLLAFNLEGRPLGRRAASACWLGLAGGWLALLEGLTHLDLLRVAADEDPSTWAEHTVHLPAPAQIASRRPGRGRAIATLSRDGRLAILLKRGDLCLMTLPGSEQRVMAVRGEHEAIEPTLLRFISADLRLMAADLAGRVIYWPRLSFP
jgi:hypothetical protein